MVSTSLFSGLSGLKANQRWMDVIGNNLANVSTPGFWGSRVTFSDVLSFTLSPGSGASGNYGGRNPTQIGLGTTIGSIDANTNQGTFLNTGRPLDVALQGKGFFTLSDGNRNFYTRVGSFGVDSNRKLVDLRTGMRVQSSVGADIDVPLTGTLPANATSTVSFSGRLPAKVSGPLEEIFTSSAAWMEGTAAEKTPSPAMSFPIDLSTISGQSFRVTVNGGTPQTVTITAAQFGGNLASVSAAQWKTGVENQLNTNDIIWDSTSGSFKTTRVGKNATLKLDNVNPGTPLTTLGFDSILSQGTETPATSATLLNELTINNKDYVNGDKIVISGTDPKGNLVGGTFTFGTTGDDVGELLQFINVLYSSTTNDGATAALDPATGQITLKANQPGEASMSISITDDGGSNKGQSAFPSFQLTRNGTGPDTVTTSIDVFDSLGIGHPISVTFTRDATDNTIWTLAATMDSSEGSVISPAGAQVRFNPDGSFNLVTGAAADLQFTFNNIATTQTVSLDFGTSGDFDGLSMLGAEATAAATDQDGYAAGNLLNMAFSEGGTLQGYYSNGKTLDISTLRIVVFNNPGGLLREGDTLFVESPNSDNAIQSVAGNSGAGAIVSGVLESSNVDIAEEFVRLIEAQRAFQANARVITTTDEILSELLSIVR
jgi:flagellar hook protein FlgE